MIKCRCVYLCHIKIRRDKFNTTVQYSIKTGEPYDIVIQPNGVERVINSICTPITDVNGLVVELRGTVQDITERHRAQSKLEYLAHHDSVTGLPNRVSLYKALDRAIYEAKINDSALAVIFLDLDNFKNINDSLGHSVRDELLVQVAIQLQGITRHNDTVARIGGDEFVLIIENIGSPNEVRIISEKVLNVFSKPLQLSVCQVVVTGSMGICMYPEDGENIEQLLANADSAMYRAKRQGRNNYQFYTKELTQLVYQRLLFENDLRRALINDELVAYYQPQIELNTKEVVGIEALVRWRHPVKGLLQPSSFISVADDSGLIIDIDNWMLSEVCQQLAKWLKQGHQITTISVNISGLQLQRGHLVESVQEALRESQISACHLELESTEGFIMRDVQSAIKQLSELRELGVSLAIDDFGTGDSSLSYLRQLPINKLKIDQSYISDIPTNQEDMVIANAIIAMSKSLGL